MVIAIRIIIVNKIIITESIIIIVIIKMIIVIKFMMEIECNGIIIEWNVVRIRAETTLPKAD